MLETKPAWSLAENVAFLNHRPNIEPDGILEQRDRKSCGNRLALIRKRHRLNEEPFHQQDRRDHGGGMRRLTACFELRASSHVGSKALLGGELDHVGGLSFASLRSAQGVLDRCQAKNEKRSFVCFSSCYYSIERF